MVALLSRQELAHGGECLLLRQSLVGRGWSCRVGHGNTAPVGRGVRLGACLHETCQARTPSKQALTREAPLSPVRERGLSSPRNGTASERRQILHLPWCVASTRSPP